MCQDETGTHYPKKTLKKTPVPLWRFCSSYITARDFVTDLLVVNDGAERGIKLMQELIDRTQDEEDLQDLAQCVSYHRKMIGRGIMKN